MQLDKWQEEFINYQGDKILVAGRQTGKSEAQAYDNAQFAATHPGTNTLLISKTERQSEELLIKTLNFLSEFYPKLIGKGKYKPLKSTVWLVHKGQKPSRVMCLPVGLAAEGIRTFTIHKLAADEAQLISDPVFAAVTPMLLTTGGFQSLSGTPQGKSGYFWKAYENKSGNWKVFHVNSEQVMKERPITESWQEWRQKAAFAHLSKEKAWMSDKQYRQEYLGEFVEDLDQVFSDDLIAKCCVLKRRHNLLYGKMYFIGVDVGRTIDPCTFEILDATNPNEIEQVESIVRKDYPITKTAQEVIEQDGLYHFQKAGIDGGGMGAGVVDILLDKSSPIRNKVIDLNNAARVVEHTWDKDKKKTLLKEDMYRNLLTMMSQGRIKLLDDDELQVSLKSCQIEYLENSKEVRIFGNWTHIVEGLIRAAWLAKEKSIKLSFDYI